MKPLTICGDGWCEGVRHIHSPNRDQRPSGIPVDLVVVHNISLPPGQFGGPYISDLFTNCLDCNAHPYFDRLREMRVSAHFLVLRSGELIQFVSTEDRAWHAGVSSFDGRARCNDFSIGIELEGSDELPFEPVQYDTLVCLTKALQARYPISAVAGHEHIAPGRKTDPGPCFDWAHYRKSLIQKEGLPIYGRVLRLPDC